MLNYIRVIKKPNLLPLRAKTSSPTFKHTETRLSALKCVN